MRLYIWAFSTSCARSTKLSTDIYILYKMYLYQTYIYIPGIPGKRWMPHAIPNPHVVVLYSKSSPTPPSDLRMSPPLHKRCVCFAPIIFVLSSFLSFSPPSSHPSLPVPHAAYVAPDVAGSKVQHCDCRWHFSSTQLTSGVGTFVERYTSRRLGFSASQGQSWRRERVRVRF